VQVGVVVKNTTTNTFTFEWENTTAFSTPHTYKNRGMEISALEYYDNKLIAFCDHGHVFELSLANGTVVNKTVLKLRDDDSAFKTEWSTIKDKQIYLGSIGKEWVNKQGKTVHEELFWIKLMSSDGTFKSENWESIYANVRKAANATFPVYLIHEAVAWDADKSQWLFFPRKRSTLPYDERVDETQGSNVLFIVSEDGSKVSHVTVGPAEVEWGFTEIKILPRPLQLKGQDKPTLLMGIKVKEVGGVIRSKITVFDTNGKLYTDPIFTELGGTKTLPGTTLPLSHVKFEALAFLPLQE